MDADQAYGEKAWRQSHKNATDCIEQVQEAASHKADSVCTPTTHFKNYPNRRARHAEYSWKSKGELINDVPLWTPSHEHVKIGRLARSYLQ